MSNYSAYTPRSKSTTTSRASSTSFPTPRANAAATGVPPLPSRPPPAHIAPVVPPPTRQKNDAVGQMPAPTSYTGSFLRARALAKVQKLTNDVAPHLESAKQTAAGKLAQLRDYQHDRDAWGDDPRLLRQVKQREREYADPTRKGSAASTQTASTSSEAGPRTGWMAGVSNYFTGNGGPDGKRQASVSAYTEEKIVCFPGWATLRPSAHSASEPALVLEVVAHGYAYRLRPLSQASRSQRVFGSLARSFAALPRIPAHLLPNEQVEAAQSIETVPQSDAIRQEALLNGNIFEQLLDIGGREGTTEEEAELARATVLASEPEQMTPEEEAKSPVQSSLPGRRSQTGASTLKDSDKVACDDESASIIPGPSKVQRKPRVTMTGGSPGSSIATKKDIAAPRLHVDRASTLPSTPITASRATSVSSQATTSTTTSSSARTSAVSTRTLSPYRDHVYHDEWPRPFQFVESDLPRLHANLQDRLLPFFGQKLPSRKVRLSIVPVLDPGTLWDRPLSTKVVSTLGGGAFKTVLEVRSKELRRLLEETGKGVDSLESLRVRVVAELLEYNPLGDVTTGGAFTGHQGLKVVAEDDCELAVAYDSGIRVISDIDDTCKHSEVLAGTKRLFRNVFVRELYEVQVPGMATWYRKMKEAQCAFHYVSNSPWELWPVIKSFLEVAKFPSGSVTLKEYGGASSALAKLWEEPGMRKRANVESIIKEFPHSQFILVGDSGEQDLELYTQLAVEYPQHILAIYIRDVTTPFSPNLHPDLSHLASQHPPHAAAATKAFSEMPDLPGQFDGSHEAPIPANPVRSLVGRKGSSFMTRSRSGTASRSASPPLFDSDSDALSPNNPLRSGTATPTVAEEQQARVEVFYARIAEAEKKVPRGILLKLFRHGREVEREALEVVRYGKTGGVPSDKMH